MGLGFRVLSMPPSCILAAHLGVVSLTTDVDLSKVVPRQCFCLLHMLFDTCTLSRFLV